MYVEMKMGMNDWKEISAEFHDDSVAIGLQSSPSKALSYQFHPVASATSFLIKKGHPGIKSLHIWQRKENISMRQFAQELTDSYLNIFKIFLNQI